MKITELNYDQVVHCPTEDEAKKLCKIMHDAGMTWTSGVSYLDRSNWLSPDTVYFPKNGTWSSLLYAKTQNKEILNLEDIEEAEIPKIHTKTVTTYEIFGREFETRQEAEDFREYIVRLSEAKNLQEIADIVSMG